MNKHGDLTLMMVMELLVVVLVGFLAFRNASLFAEQETIYKNAIADDIQMMINTLVAVPGDGVVKYPQNVTGYNLILNENSIVVFKSGESIHKQIKRIFFLPEGYRAFGVIENKNQFCLNKEKRTIVLDDCPIFEDSTKIAGEMIAEEKIVEETANTGST
ncbi:hypothetical protein HYX12_02845 [Candidatus Woesearchaeota archaeon]|nr:hypothetical protein [Candidatus Woesearchaeota archaeon]